MSSSELERRKANLSEAKRALLERRLRGKSAVGDRDPGIVARSEAGPFQLSYTQQRIWFLQQLYPASRAYSMSEAWRIHGPLDTSALHQALQRIVDRHAALRTSFRAPDDEPLQFVADRVELSLPITNLAELPATEREAAAADAVMANSNYAFDLQKGPLFQPSLIRLGREEHILQLTLHHIITDEWSNDVIWRELSHFYGAALNGVGNDLPAVPIQYSDYAHWQRGQVASGRLEAQMGYWLDQLGGELPVLQLPSDHARPAEQSLRGAVIRRLLPAALLADLQSLSQEAGTTLFGTLLAAYYVLLYRYTRQQDLLVGTPIANRQRAETRNVVGMFINTAVARAKVSRDLSFRELLDQTKNTVLNALANQDLPFDLLVQSIQPDRDPSYNPVFQTMFVLLSNDAERTLPGLTFEAVPIDPGVSKFDLTLFAGEEEGQLISALEYSTDLFEKATAERMLDHWETLLSGIAADADVPIGTLPLLGARERELVLRTWNDTASPIAEEKPVHALIADQARRHPQAEAVIAVDERLTYGELEARAGRLAARLQRAGVERGTPVGLYIERSAAMLVGILGILKAGAAYVPLEPSYPAERIGFALQDTEAPAIVTRSDLAEGLPPHNATVILLDEDTSTDSIDTAPAEQPATLDDLAYIIYTSGSTGQPKGVMVTHRNLLASTLARAHYYEQSVERFLLLSSFAFDSSVAGIFWTLTDGGALVLPAPDEEKDVRRLAGLIQHEQVTHTLALPTLYRLLLTYAPADSLDSLRAVVVAGEACAPDLGEKHNDRLPHSRLYNEYGPTEATVWCSVYQLPPSVVEEPVPIGRPIANCQLIVLDDRRQPVPIGVPGELYVGGAGVTPGYWRNQELTAQRFVNLSSVSPSENGRFYRTGDLVSWRADGELIFLGRVDNQVKLRGHRIEPGEIEALLLRHPDVNECVVTVENLAGVNGSTGQSLVAYVVGHQQMAGGQVQDYLRQHLPDYMIPHHVIPLPALPRTPNGKVDRAQLPTPDVSLAEDRVHIPPRNDTEAVLARIWSEILGLPHVSVDDKFFELGGDSLMIIQVIARARQEGLELTPRQLMAQQTIRRLAAVADGQANAEKDPVLVPLKQEGSKPPVFFVHGISGSLIWLANLLPLLDPERPVYGLQSYGLQSGTEPDTSIEAMAARYLEAVRQVQPVGPYHFGGFCFGGIVAYEMARQLELAGEKTALLAVIDAFPTGLQHRKRPLYDRLRLKLIRESAPYWFRGYKVFGGWRLKERVFRKFNWQVEAERNVEFSIERLAKIGFMEDFVAAEREIQVRVSENNKRVQKAHRALPYGGHVTVFCPRLVGVGKALFGPIDPERGWLDLAEDGVTTRFVNGSHVGFLRSPFVSDLATQLNNALEQVRLANHE